MLCVSSLACLSAPPHLPEPVAPCLGGLDGLPRKGQPCTLAVPVWFGDRCWRKDTTQGFPTVTCPFPLPTPMHTDPSQFAPCVPVLYGELPYLAAAPYIPTMGPFPCPQDTDPLPGDLDFPGARGAGRPNLAPSAHACPFAFSHPMPNLPCYTCSPCLTCSLPPTCWLPAT